MKLKVKRLRPGSKLPWKATPGAAAYDLYASLEKPIVLQPRQVHKVPTGIAIEIPDGYVGLIYDRSGMFFKRKMKTGGGVIDSDYRDEILVGLFPVSGPTFDEKIEDGERIGQIIFMKYEDAEIEETDTLSETSRGAGCVSSTGK